jgi:hypothetical protein
MGCGCLLTGVSSPRQSDYAAAVRWMRVALLGGPAVIAVWTVHRERRRRVLLEHSNRLIAVRADETGCLRIGSDIVLRLAVSVAQRRSADKWGASQRPEVRLVYRLNAIGFPYTLAAAPRSFRHRRTPTEPAPTPKRSNVVGSGTGVADADPGLLPGTKLVKEATRQAPSMQGP